MATKHTLGPWQVVPATEHHGPFVTTEDDRSVCDLYAMSGPGSIGGGGKPKPCSFHNAEANAALIAAAPDMLEALKALDTAWADSFPGGPETVEYAQRAREIWAQIRAAIAKAEGRS